MRTAVLVTGGAGYIGAHTCKALYRAGFTPVTLDNLCQGHRDFVRWGPLVESDIRDAACVENICREYDVAAAIHFAAYACVGESVTNPRKYYLNNVTGSLGLLEGLQNAGVNSIVFSSSCAVYGAPSTQPISESTPPAPINAYGMSKLFVERILADYSRAYGLTWYALRYFNACGADFDCELGELRVEETHLIPRAMMWIQGHLDSFQVYGADYPTPDGTAVRDYIHVCDLADAHVLALQRLLAGEDGGVLNLGSGRGHSVEEVLSEIRSITKCVLPNAVSGRREGDPPVLIADPGAAKKRLGFATVHSDLPTILTTAWAWHQKAHPSKQRA